MITEDQVRSHLTIAESMETLEVQARGAQQVVDLLALHSLRQLGHPAALDSSITLHGPYPRHLQRLAAITIDCDVDLSAEQVEILHQGLEALTDEFRRFQRTIGSIATAHPQFDLTWESQQEVLTTDNQGREAMRKAVYLADSFLWFYDHIGYIVPDFITGALDHTINSRFHMASRLTWKDAQAWATANKRMIMNPQDHLPVPHWERAPAYRRSHLGAAELGKRPRCSLGAGSRHPQDLGRNGLTSGGGMGQRGTHLALQGYRR